MFSVANVIGLLNIASSANLSQVLVQLEPAPGHSAVKNTLLTKLLLSPVDTFLTGIALVASDYLARQRESKRSELIDVPMREKATALLRHNHANHLSNIDFFKK